MKKRLVLLLLTVLSTAVIADWTELAKSDSGTFYVDRATIRRTGALVRIWTLHDQSNPITQSNGKSMISTRSHDEFDCKKDARRTLSMTNHSGHMAAGDVVFTYDRPQRWTSVAPGSMGQGIWDSVCKE